MNTLFKLSTKAKLHVVTGFVEIPSHVYLSDLSKKFNSRLILILVNLMAFAIGISFFGNIYNRYIFLGACMEV